MKRTSVCRSSDDSETNVNHKTSKFGQQRLESLALNFQFMPSKRHLACVNYVYSWAVRHLEENIGDTEFAIKLEKTLTDDLDMSSGAMDLLKNMACEVEMRINQWITFIDRFIFNIRNENKTRVMRMMDCLVWTREGMINYTDSALRLLRIENLGDEEKLKIACVHCLTDHIEKYLKLVDLSNLFNVYEKTGQIIYLWNKYFEEKNSEDDNLVDIVLEPQLFDIFGYSNRAAIMFIWYRLSESAKSAGVIKLMKNADVDSQCMLLSKMNRSQQLGVFKKCASSILNNMMADFIWSKYLFSTVSFVGHVISNRHYYKILEKATAIPHNYMFAITKHRRILPELWKRLPSRVHDYMLTVEEDIDIINGLMLVATDVNEIKNIYLKLDSACQRQVLESHYGSKVCAKLITFHEEYEFVDFLLDSVFGNPEDISEFKKKLRNKTKGLWYSIKKMKDLYRLDIDLHWFAPVESEAIEYKRTAVDMTLVFTSWLRDAVYINAQSSEPRDQVDFTKINALLAWSGLSDNQILNSKLSVIDPSGIRHDRDIILDLVEIKRYDLADQVLQWFLTDPQSIHGYKIRFFEKFIKIKLTDFVGDLLNNDDQFIALDRYVDWNFSLNDEKLGFKRLFLKECRRPPFRPFDKLLYAGKIDLADKLLKWCGLTDDHKVQSFKRESTVAIRSEHEIRERVEQPDFSTEETLRFLSQVIKLTEWFDPSDDEL